MTFVTIAIETGGGRTFEGDYSFSRRIPSTSAIRTRSANDFAAIFRMTFPR
jgi:hypothetical protein